MAEPKLQPPGTGLPIYEALFLKHIFMPVTLKIMPWDESQKMFLEQTDKIIGLYQSVPADKRTQKILIPRLMGLEDSSRYWSANMVLEHVMLVTSGMTSIIEALATEQKLDFRVDTAKVKPKGLTEDDMVGGFWELMHQCADRVNAVINRTSTTTHDHPWFGALNTHGWHSLLPIHSSIHRRQLEKIAGNLGK